MEAKRYKKEVLRKISIGVGVVKDIPGLSAPC